MLSESLSTKLKKGEQADDISRIYNVKRGRRPRLGPAPLLMADHIGRGGLAAHLKGPAGAQREPSLLCLRWGLAPRIDPTGDNLRPDLDQLPDRCSCE